MKPMIERYPRVFAAIAYWLTWFIPLSAWGVYDMLTRPPYGHSFEYGPEGAILSVIYIAVVVTLYSPVAITTLIVLGRIERISALRLAGTFAIAALFSGLVLVAAFVFPEHQLPNQLSKIVAVVCIFLVSAIATFATIYSAVRWGYIRRLKVEGVCGFCGYDLRGSVGPQCPECGEVINAPSPTPAGMQ